MKKIGIATCADWPQLTDADRGLAHMIEKNGFQVEPLIWNQVDVSKKNWDVLLLRSTWDYHHHSQLFLEWLLEIEKLSIRLVNSAEVVRWNVQKNYLQDLAEQNVRIVPSIFVEKGRVESNVIRMIQKTGWTKIVLKPTISATAYLTIQTSITDSELPQYIRQIQKQSDLVVQPFIESVTTQGEASLIYFRDTKAQFSHAVLKRPKGGDFRVQSNFGGQVEVFRPSSDLQSFALSCVQAIPGDWTYARVDIIDWNKKPLLGELELIEPDLFLTYDAYATEKFVDVLMKTLKD